MFEFVDVKIDGSDEIGSGSDIDGFGIALKIKCFRLLARRFEN
uniref:Ribose-5-phosphate isomerase n=1 Tax=Panagrolaimus sp. ES5 TaxID=591445 RepID=A0AC34G6Q2_9BILA